MQNRREIIATMFSIDDYPDFDFLTWQANGLRYLRWGGDGEAVQPEK